MTARKIKVKVLAICAKTTSRQEHQPGHHSPAQEPELPSSSPSSITPRPRANRAAFQSTRFHILPCNSALHRLLSFPACVCCTMTLPAHRSWPSHRGKLGHSLFPVLLHLCKQFSQTNANPQEKHLFKSPAPCKPGAGTALA